MAGKDELANAVLGGASDFISDIAQVFLKLFRASNDEEKVIITLTVLDLIVLLKYVMQY